MVFPRAFPRHLWLLLSPPQPHGFHPHGPEARPARDTAPWPVHRRRERHGRFFFVRKGHFTPCSIIKPFNRWKFEEKKFNKYCISKNLWELMLIIYTKSTCLILSLVPFYKHGRAKFSVSKIWILIHLFGQCDNKFYSRFVLV